MIAFAKSEAGGFHHASWDIASTHEVGLGAQQMADAGYRAGWGLGRHVLGSNYFHYVRDPWGSYSEYSSDHRLHPGGNGLGGRPLHARERLLSVGTGAAAGFRHQLRGGAIAGRRTR